MNIVTIKEKISFIDAAFGEGNLSNSGKNISVFCPICKKSAKTAKKRKLSINGYKSQQNSITFLYTVLRTVHDD